MSVSLSDYQDFILLWIQKRTGVHRGDLYIYPTLTRHCLCCQARGNYDHRTSGLCPKCCEGQTCLLCAGAFAPSKESVGVFCPECWTGMEAAWKNDFDEGGHAAAEAKVRAALMAARPRLTGCVHGA